ncbi:MAG: YheU family protein [Pseudomonadota bacterium]
MPWESLSQDALRGVIEEFVTREGTEYGAQEVPLPEKIADVLAQLRSGQAAIVYDPALESVSIVTTQG